MGYPFEADFQGLGRVPPYARVRAIPPLLKKSHPFGGACRCHMGMFFLKEDRMPRRNKPYRVAPGRKPDEIDEVLYQMKHRTKPVPTYQCARCRKELQAEASARGVEHKRIPVCFSCAARPLPSHADAPEIDLTPRPRANMALQLAESRQRIIADWEWRLDDEECERQIRDVMEHPERYGLTPTE